MLNIEKRLRKTLNWKKEREEFCLLIPALLPLHTEVHAHGDGELLVVDGEDVQDLHVNVHIDGAVRDGGLELLVILGQTPAEHTLGHSCKVEKRCFSICLSLKHKVSFNCRGEGFKFTHQDVLCK